MNVVHIDIPGWFVPVGWAIIALGLLLFLWAFFWDWLRRGRRRDMPRCPKCWYDMRGSASLQCPECGRTVKSPRRLRRSRRRLGWAVFALLLIAAGAVARYADRVNSNWYPYVPNWVLMLIVRDPCPPIAGGYLAGPITIPQRLTQELWIRAAKHELSVAQRRTLLNRQFNDAFPPVVIHTRTKWPVGVAVRFSVDHAYLGLLKRDLVAIPNAASLPALEVHSSYPFEGESQYLEYLEWPERTYESTEYIETLRDTLELSALTYDVTIVDDGDLHWTRHISVPIERVNSIDDALHAVRDPSVTASFAQLLRRELHLSDDCQWLVLSDAATRAPLDLTFAAEYEICYRGEPVATANSVWRVRSSSPAAPIGSMAAMFGQVPDNPHSIWMFLHGDIEALQTADFCDPDWVVHVVCDPILALNDFESDRYWCGELVMPCSELHDLKPHPPVIPNP